MKSKSRIASLLAVLIAMSAVSNPLHAREVAVTVDVGGEGRQISPNIFGIFFEDINHAADGGLYAELIRNRDFDFEEISHISWNAFTGWELVARGGGHGWPAIDAAVPIHQNNQKYVVLNVGQVGDGVGLRNSGFGGIVVREGENYNFSVFARQLYMEHRWGGPGIEGRPMPLEVRLERRNGEVLARASIEARGGYWHRLTATLTATGSDDNAQFVILARARGGIALDVISLFPAKTFRNRPNGLRADIAQAIADMRPRFFRFPGGCLVHGSGIGNMYRWQDTIGPIETRQGQPNIWGYHQSVGLGYFEYFQFSEDIGAIPIPVVPAGVSCQNSGHMAGIGQQAIPLEEMPAFIQDIFNLIEWANGPATSKWGAKRAAAGRVEPFNLQYLQVGNEDAQTPEFFERFKLIYDAVNERHPEITVIGNVGPAPYGPEFEAGWAFANQHGFEMVAEHFYRPPSWFIHNLRRYDTYDRNQSPVFISEYAAHDEGRRNTLRSAIAEAAFMTGLERNGDIVRMACYAPLLGKIGNTQWNPNLIYFTNTDVLLTANYHVQKLFGNNAGDVYLPTTVVSLDQADQQPPAHRNGILLGTWNSQARFDQVRVVKADGTVTQPSVNDWETRSGAWSVRDGALVQTSTDTPALSLFSFSGDRSAYTLTLRAMKTGGAEGFLIGFGAKDAENYYWLNLGGWGNTSHQLEKTIDGSRSAIGRSSQGGIENNRWYDIRIEVRDNRIRGYLDGNLIVDAADTGHRETVRLAASTVRDTETGDLILKLVNPRSEPISARIDLRGLGAIEPNAAKTVLTGDPMAVNDESNPHRVSPQTSGIRVAQNFTYAAPAYSLTVLRIQPRRN